MPNKQHSILCEIGRLLIEAQIARMKNTAVSVIVSQDQAEATVKQSQLKASVSKDSNRQP